MEENSWAFHIGPIWFDGPVSTMVILTCLLVFLFVFVCSRNLQMKPKGKQNLLEYIIDFVSNIVNDNLGSSEVRNFQLLSVTFFLFVLFSNTLGLVTKLVVGDDISLWKSPTADPAVTLTLAMMMILLTNCFGLIKFGPVRYFKNSFMSPVSFLMPVKLMEEFTSVLTLGLRLYGNIYAGEVLLTLIASMGVSSIKLLPLAIPLEMIWQAFSLCIGGIQAFIFVTLSMVYMSHKVLEEH